MDRPWLQLITRVLDLVLVKGALRIGIAILALQLVLWVSDGNWRSWSFGSHDLGDWNFAAEASEPYWSFGARPEPRGVIESPWLLSRVNSFFWALPLFLFVPLASWTLVGAVYIVLMLVVSLLVQCSAFFRQMFVRRSEGRPKHIAICTDGTWNYPTQMEDGATHGTNVYKFWELLKGERHPNLEFWVGANRYKKLVEERDGKKQITQIGLYYNGVGNKAEHTSLGIAIGGACGLGANRIVKRAYRDLIRFYREYRDGSKDKITIVGFSRGAAVARLLAGEVGKRGLPRYAFSDLPVIRWFAYPLAKWMGTWRKVDVDLLGVWDTVASFGLAKPILGIPFQRINLFKDLTVGKHVKKAVHMVALDEQRDAFRPTLMSPDATEPARIDEVWFAGNHSNVGGGYMNNPLSNVPLRYLCLKAKEAIGRELQYRDKDDLERKYAERKKDPEDLAAVFGLDKLASILHPKDVEEQIAYELMNGKVEREVSPVYENAPRNVPDHAVFDASVTGMLFFGLESESLMQHYERRCEKRDAHKKMFDALVEAGIASGGEKDWNQFERSYALEFNTHEWHGLKKMAAEMSAEGVQSAESAAP